MYDYIELPPPPPMTPEYAAKLEANQRLRDLEPKRPELTAEDLDRRCTEVAEYRERCGGNE